MVNDDHATILHGYWDTGLQRFWGHEFDLLTSSITWPSDSAWALSYCWSMMTMRLSCTVTEILGPKDIVVTSLTFRGHVTSLVTWPLDSAHVVFYWWSIGTKHLSCEKGIYILEKFSLYFTHLPKAPNRRICTKFCTGSQPVDVIACFKFCVDRLRGFGSARGRILPFSLYLAGRR